MAGDRYPSIHGTPMKGVLPDYLSPLNIAAEPGDSDVPANDMGEVAGSLVRGTSVPDPNAYVSPIEKSKGSKR